MNRLYRKERRGARLAILLTLFGCWALDAEICRGQAAGFAQSRQQAPARVESGGGVRAFVSSLNPFKSDDDETPKAAPSYGRVSFAAPTSNVASNLPSATEERATLIVSPSPNAVSASRPSAKAATGRALVGAETAAFGPDLAETSRPAAARALGTTRPAESAIGSVVAPAFRSASVASSSKRSSTGGVAALLLDELEKEIGDAPAPAPSKSRASAPTIARRSLRDEGTLDALELIDAGSEIVAEDESDADADADADESTISTDSDGAILADDESDAADANALDEDGPAIPAFAESPRGAKRETTSKKPARSTKQDAQNVARSTGETSALDARFSEILDRDSSSDVVEIAETFNETGEKKTSKKRVVASNGAAWGGSEENADESANERSTAAASAANADETRVSVGSPVVEIETFGPKKLFVGRETTYKIRVRNAGDFAANRLVVSTELPESVVASSASPQIGTAEIDDAPLDSVSDAKRCVWNVGTLESGAEFELTLKLTPTKRSAFELVSRFEFERSAARTGVEVQEAILEARVEGRDEIERGVEDKYRLRVRNVGNGDAENVELFVSTGENEATQRLGVLKAGEEKTIEMAVKTNLEGSIAINVRATGLYGVEATASKEIAILRGKLETTIEAPELQFVESEFDAVVRARNVGDAALQDVDVVAQTPETVELLSCAGNARRNEEKRRIYWSIPLLRPGEEVAYRVRCRLTGAGDATFAVAGSERSGETTQAEATVQVESIAALAMRVKTPKAPVAVGKECVYELTIENNGTKDAQAIDSGVFLGAGMKPLAVEGEAGAVYESESKVIFKQIDRLAAGESVVFRVRAEAVAPGNHKIQAMLQSIPEDARLLTEETTYCYDRSRATRDVSERSPSIVALEPAESESTRRK